jgi:hypothetical protein
MPLKLRRIIWDDGKPSRDREDFDVVDERDERIGRMYRTIAVGGGEAIRRPVRGRRGRPRRRRSRQCGQNASCGGGMPEQDFVQAASVWRVPRAALPHGTRDFVAAQRVSA